MYARTPYEIADLIKDLIKDKTIVDLGCAEGEFLKALQPHAQEVKGVEQVTVTSQIARDQGFDIDNINLFNYPFNETEIYYSYLDKITANQFIEFIETQNIKGTFIIGQTNDYCVDKYLESITTETRIG